MIGRGGWRVWLTSVKDGPLTGEIRQDDITDFAVEAAVLECKQRAQELGISVARSKLMRVERMSPDEVADERRITEQQHATSREIGRIAAERIAAERGRS